ncbi:hypothetical protein F5Y18DRAFT_376011 [Xylariaceae sp. FL1019]|nr:hypothetical protein F5Y18DRAFT_376011 [Xylariaceae sp. FL1019]
MLVSPPVSMCLMKFCVTTPFQATLEDPMWPADCPDRARKLAVLCILCILCSDPSSRQHVDHTLGQDKRRYVRMCCVGSVGDAKGPVRADEALHRHILRATCADVRIIEVLLVQHGALEHTTHVHECITIADASHSPGFSPLDNCVCPSHSSTSGITHSQHIDPLPWVGRVAQTTSRQCQACQRVGHREHEQFTQSQASEARYMICW